MSKLLFRKNENMKIAIKENIKEKVFKKYKEKIAKICVMGGYMNNYNNVMGLQNCSDMGF